jgi:flagellar hook-length control protein FliK
MGAASVAPSDAAMAKAADGGGAKAAGTGAPTYNAATAQTAAAAALSAAANGIASAASAVAAASSQAGSSPSPTDDSAPPAAAAVAQDAGIANVAATPAAAVPVAGPATAAAAQSVAALADLGAADKRSHGGGNSSLPDTGGGGAAGAAQLSTNTTTAADAAPTPTLKVPARVDTPEFAQGLADRVSLMVDNNLNGAKLQVNPPQLGPIDVRIAVQGDQAQVWLSAHSAVTRDALESSSEKLREMLGAQGFAQVSVDISQRSFQERSTHAQPYDWTPSASGSTSTLSSSAASMPRLSSGAVDAYA